MTRSAFPSLQPSKELFETQSPGLVVFGGETSVTVAVFPTSTMDISCGMPEFVLNCDPIVLQENRDAPNACPDSR